MLPRTIAGLVLLAAVAGCGSTTHLGAGGTARTGSASGDAAVIRGWADALARGDIAAAGSYFATPSRIQIATNQPLVTARSAADVRAVNLALPCGAKLLDSRPLAGYVDALFRLTTRPGADCGTGVGATARVAFRITAGKIAVWRRIPDEAGDGARAAPGTRPTPVPPTARSI